jgi:LmbE family N-acetylglucosaminyl deacetylase
VTHEQPLRRWGRVDDATVARALIVSPHLDDAVLGCGQLMSAHPGATVVTVFTGNPDEYPTPMRLWDEQSGFAPGDDVMDVRRREDAAALAVLGARPVHLGYVEHTYLPGDRPVAPEVIAPVLADAIEGVGPSCVIIPFGLANPDHDATHRAAMLVRDRFTDVPWFCYEDMGYKHIPGMLAWRVARLFRGGIWPTPALPVTDGSIATKMRAVRCYPTQLRALDDDWRITDMLAAPAPEQLWELNAPPAGWESLAEIP